jgi:hypothetical protein
MGVPVRFLLLGPRTLTPQWHYPLFLQFNIKLYNFIQADAPRGLKERGR